MRKTREKLNAKGITLIALVVTIVVLLILAGISLNLVLGNNGIITKAEEARYKYSNASANEEEQLNNANEQIDKLVGKEYEGLTITADIPDVIFTKADGTTPGDINNLETGDIVKYGDYEYHFNQSYERTPFYVGWVNNSELDGWGVSTIDNNKSKYGELCGNILGKKLKNIDFLFGSGASVLANKNLVIAPKIPNGVESMGSTFQGCDGLETVTEIPSSVTDMSYTFFSCAKLQGSMEINANPTSYNNCFNGASTEGSGLVVTGSSTMLDTLIATKSNNANITKGE